MSYRIEYTVDRAIKRPAKWPGSLKFSLISGISAGLILGFLVFFPKQVAAVRQAILPDPETVAAFLEDIESGTRFSDAVTVFCEALLHGKN